MFLMNMHMKCTCCYGICEKLYEYEVLFDALYVYALTECMFCLTFYGIDTR